MKPTPKPQPASPAPRSRRALSVARTLLLRLLIRATIAAILVSLVAWTCALRARLHNANGVILIRGHHENGSFHFMSPGMIVRDFGAAKVDTYFRGINFYRDHTIPSAEALGFRSNPVFELMDHSSHWALLELPTPPDSLEMSAITTIACGYPFMAYRAVSIAHEVKYQAPLRHSPEIWSGPVPRTASIGPALPIQPSSPSQYRGFVISHRPATLIHLNWGHFPTTSLPSFIQPIIANNRTLPSHIPIAPYWPGLLANTAIYTAIIWFLCWSLATLHRGIHRWRNPNANPCKHCRYDLTGITQSVCPECGHPMRQQSSDRRRQEERPA